MKELVAFDLDGTLAESKQPLQEPMGEALADLLDVAHVAVISGGDWPQFEKQVASRLPERADRTKLWLMPTTGTKLYRFDDAWRAVYAELFEEDEKQKILKAFDESLEATGFVPEAAAGPGAAAGADAAAMGAGDASVAVVPACAVRSPGSSNTVSCPPSAV